MGHRQGRRRARWAIGTLAVVLAMAGAGSASAAPPTASFSWAPQVPNPGQAVAFDASASSASGGSIRSYDWNFGDGSSSSGVTPSHTYTSPGDKTVTLTVTADADGATAQSTQTVHVNAPPTATFVYAAVNPPAGQDPFTPLIGQQVAFSAQGSSDPDGSIATYEWDLGDGTFGSPATVSWLITTFPTAGPRTIRLRVTDNNGATAVFSHTLRVNSPPVAGFSYAPSTPHTGDTVTFTSTATDPDGASDLASTTWDLNGDGTFGDASGPTAHASFLTAGDYTIAEKVTDTGGATATVFHTITVLGQPAPPSAGGASPGGGTPAVVPAPAGGSTAGGSTGNRTPSTGGATSGSSRTRVLTSVHVRFAGSVTADLTTLTSLTVVAPKGVTISVRCQGQGCPRSFHLPATTTGNVRIAQLRRTYRAGAVITIQVAKKGFLTKVIQIRFLRGRAPQRVERCLFPAGKKHGQTTKQRVAACPRS